MSQDRRNHGLGGSGGERGRGLCMTHTLSSHCHFAAVALEDFWSNVGSLSPSPSLPLRLLHGISASSLSPYHAVLEAHISACFDAGEEEAFSLLNALT